MLDNCRKGPIPLVVGVAGHRDLVPDDVPQIRRRVGEFFSELAKDYPHTPVVLLSELAEGADRIVADVAQGFGVQLYAVLPMAQENYERDFQSESSLLAFRQLLRASTGSATVTSGFVPAEGPDRDEAYGAAASFLVHYSQILVALWNGVRENSDKIGGTSYTVSTALGQSRELVSGPEDLLRWSEGVAVYFVPVRRASDERTELPFAPGYSTSPHENLKALERFNSDAVERETALQAGIESSADSVLPAEFCIENTPLNFVRRTFAVADSLAIYFRNAIHRSLQVIFAGIGLALAFFIVYTDVFPDTFTVPTLVLYVACLVLVVAVYLSHGRLRRGFAQDRYQDYRALAEGLRVQLYWWFAGIHEPVYNRFLALHEGELAWIRDALRALRFCAGQPEEESGSSITRMRDLSTLWIDSQRRYFAGAAKNELTRFRSIDRWIGIAVIVAVAMMGLRLFLAAVDTFFQHPIAGHSHFELLERAIEFVLNTSVAAAGLMTGYIQLRAYPEHARRYDRMRRLYDAAHRELTKSLDGREDGSGDLRTARVILKQLGVQSLGETCDWLLLHREREIEIPIG